jgi:hypothetical protein
MINFKNAFSAESIENLTVSLSKVHLRFPFTLLCSFLATIFFIYFIETEPENHEYGKLVATFYLGVPLLLAIELFNERKYLNKWLTIGLGLAVLVVFYLFTQIENEYKELNRFQLSFFGLAIIFHLLVSVAPYLKKGNVAAFWQYNKTLFLAILNAFLYSLSLSGGLCLAILAIDKLFEVNVNNDWYRNIFLFTNGYCNTVFFLAKLPSLEAIDNKTDDYPIGLKYFTQYVLLPLVAIYILIILAYELKIIVNWSLPKGWVSVLVMASAIFGILAFLLLYPLRFANKWIANFTKLYYWLLIPLIALMMIAIYVRISEYGVTEPRYYIALMAIWLLGISLYFSISEIDNIKIIPISLIIIGLLSIFGPFNAFFISRYNQQQSLETVLLKNNMLKNGKIEVPKSIKISSTDQQKLSASIEYLSKNNVRSLQKYLSEKDFKDITSFNKYDKQRRFLELTNLPNKTEKTNQLKAFYRTIGSVEPLYGSDYSIFFDRYNNQLINLEKTAIQMLGNNAIIDNNCKLIVDNEVVMFNLSDLLLLTEPNEPTEKMTFLQESKLWKLRLIIDNINFKNNQKIDNFSGKIFFTKK